MLKRFGLAIMSMIMVIAIATPGLAQASSNEVSTGKEVENTKRLIDSINELDQKLDMENLSSNSHHEINQLSADAKKLYNTIVNYENEKPTDLTSDDAIIILSNYLAELNNNQENKSQINKSKVNDVTVQALGINYKEYKISNSKIKELNKLVGLNSGFWATVAAVGKVFAKSPTALTLMLGAVPFLGIGAINVCNSKDRGIIITKFGSGTTNSYSCKSQ